MKVLRWLTAAISLALVVGVTQWESRQRTSPGALHPSHAGVAELRGGRGCVACHGPPGGGEASMAEACNGCHGAVREQAASASGIHGRLDAATLNACDACHREHGGGVLALVADSSFRAAGLGGMDDFDHAQLVPFDLTGRHDELACRDCHLKADAGRLEAGERRFLGLTRACVSCHEDPHRGDLGADCAGCHGQVHAFDRAAQFVHDEAFPLAGGHADVACRACHEVRGTNLIEEVRDAGVPAQTCADCHASPHRPGFLEAVAGARRRASGNECAPCHEAAHGSFLGPAAAMPPGLHSAAGFALEPPHDGLRCEQCHAGYGRRGRLESGSGLASRFAAIFPGRSPQDCRACHGDPHGGQFDAGWTRGRCDSCHAATHFLPSTYDVADHARCRFPLTGAHEAVACDRCHAMEGAQRRFVPTASACADCHRDPHGGRYDRPRRPAAAGDRGGCTQCHETSSFTDVRWTSAAHEQWSGYPLAGAHARVACSGCHERQALREGFVLNAPSRDCAACHADPHAGQFRRDGRTDCARCHAETDRFGEIRFDHQKDSRFALDEHHRTLECAACHRPVAAPGGAPVVRYRPLGTRCADCHGSMGAGRARG